jgi:hypothetical protein
VKSLDHQIGDTLPLRNSITGSLLGGLLNNNESALESENAHLKQQVRILQQNEAILMRKVAT